MRLLRRPGRRGEALLFFALVDVLYALRLLYPPEPLGETFTWPQSLMPLWAWAICWGGVGLICLVFAFLDADTPAFIAAVMLKIGWGIVSLLGWLSGELDGGYAQAAIWLGAAWLVFRVAGGIPPPRGRVEWKDGACSPSTSR